MNVKTLLKVVVSIGMLALVIRAVDLKALIATALQLNVWAVALVVIMYGVGQALNSVKWWRIAQSGGIDASYPQALRASFIGMYVNCFGLGTVGGDLVRGLLLARAPDQRLTAFASVVADRAHGLAILATIGAVTTIVFGAAQLDSFYTALVVVLSLGIAIGWFVGPKLLLMLLPGGSKIRERAERIVAVFPSGARELLTISAISALFHLFQIAMHWVMGLSVGINIPFSLLLVTVPFVNILSTLPMSWNGLGVRETSYLFFMVPAVISAEHSVLFGALWLLSVVVSSAVGGILSLWSKDFDLIRSSEPSPARG